MQLLTSIYRDEENRPLISLLDTSDMTVHLVSSVDSSEVLCMTYQNYIDIKFWLNL